MVTDFRANVKFEKDGNIQIEIPDLSCVLKLTKSYYQKHATRMEDDKEKIKEMIFPPAQAQQQPPAQPAA